MQERLQVADVAQVYHLWNEYAAALNAGDMERWLALWAEDGLQMPSDAPRRAGKAEIRSGMASQFGHFDTGGVNIQPEEVRILGDQAFAHGTYEFKQMPKKGGESKRYSGSFLSMMAKQLDGSWQITIDCRNYDQRSG